MGKPKAKSAEGVLNLLDGTMSLVPKGSGTKWEHFELRVRVPEGTTTGDTYGGRQPAYMEDGMLVVQLRKLKKGRPASL